MGEFVSNYEQNRRYFDRRRNALLKGPQYIKDIPRQDGTHWEWIIANRHTGEIVKQGTSGTQDAAYAEQMKAYEALTHGVA